MSMTRIALESISKSFGDVEALNQVSAEIRSGEVLGIVGPNGSGKSTLVKVLSGFMKPNEGSIRMSGQTVRFASPRQAIDRGVILIEQDDAVFPHLTVEENIVAGQEPVRLSVGMRMILDRKERARIAKEALATFARAEIPLDQLAGTLSGGQRKSMAIARAMLRKPTVLVLDEVTNSLGVFEKGKVYEAIRFAKEQDVALVFISHDLVAVRSVCDQVLVLQAGRTVQYCPLGTLNDSELSLLMAGGGGRND